MAKNGSTKGKILKMIAAKNKTLSDISKELRLAPSTVSQHLQELREMGAVQEVENDHIKKWKYYKLNPDFDYQALGVETRGKIGGNVPGGVFFYAVGIAIVAVAAYAVFLAGGSNIQKSSIVQVMLTDPPIVPEGTQALYVNYSSVSLHTVSGGGSEWIESGINGSVNLMSLINFSQEIAGIEVAHNSQIDRVRFNITSATVVINGTSYPVFVPSSHVTAVVDPNRSVNASSEVLVDLSPIVFKTALDNSTIFVMVPRAGALLAFANKSRILSHGRIIMGRRARLDAREMARLYRLDSNFSGVRGFQLNSTLNASVLGSNASDVVVK